LFLGFLIGVKKGLLRKPFRCMAPRGGLEPPTNGLTAHAKTLKNS